MDAPVIYNCHTHTFTASHLPVRFPPRWLKFLMRVRFLRKILIYVATRVGILLRLISVVLPLDSFSNSMLTIDTLKRFERFFETGMNKSQEQVFKQISSQYPEKSRFVVLPMDMEFMGAGRPEVSYRAQLDELVSLYQSNPETIIPFFAADPRRNGVVELFTEYIEKHGFKGVKIYPNLGYFPYAPKLKEIYAICEQKGIPVLAHCSPGGISLRGITQQEAQAFAHPANYETLLTEFPRLNFCLAHFGGNQEWEKSIAGKSPRTGEDASWLTVILDMLVSGKYPNLYTDVSYTLFCETPSYRPFTYFDYLKVMLVDKNVHAHVLFGSDYYMVEQERVSEKEVSIALRSRLGEEMYFQIANENPRRFLYEVQDVYSESEDERRIAQAWHSAA